MLRRSRTAALVSAAFFAGVIFHASISEAWAVGFKKLDVFARVLAYVENNYVEEVDETQLMYGAIKGMLSTLDNHTLFFAPDDYKEMRADTSGEFGGLGVEVAADPQGLVVIAPIDDTPAQRAGIQPGDKIVAIDGESTHGITVPAAVKKMRGQVGTKVNLTIHRTGFAAPREFALLRDRVRVKSVDARLHPGAKAGEAYGYVRIKSFQERTDVHLGKALARLHEENGGKPLKGLVLDLRNNPGGLLDQAVRVADRFLEEGLIVSTEGRGGKQLEVERAHAAGTEEAYPMVVLVNGGSASASEIVAGALQDHGRAVVMGTTSFGKGSVQTVIDLDDGSGLKLTIAKYFTPKHRSIHGKGIDPDVVVADKPDQPDKADKPEKSGGATPAAATGRGEVRDAKAGSEDLQLDRALEALRDWERFQASVRKPAPKPQPEKRETARAP